MENIKALICGAAFMVALGVVGAVENGADISLMGWAFGAIAVFGAAILTAKEG